MAIIIMANIIMANIIMAIIIMAKMKCAFVIRGICMVCN
jgi:hypothetical protein